MDNWSAHPEQRPPSLAARDPKQAAALLLRGEKTLAQVAGVTEEDLASLRALVGDLMQLGRFSQALTFIDALLGLGDGHPALPFLRANCLERNGDFPGAAEALRRALQQPQPPGLEDLVAEARAHLVELEAKVA